MTKPLDREAVPEPLNPLGIDGIEFIEFATSKPQALGGVLETMGFRPIAWSACGAPPVSDASGRFAPGRKSRCRAGAAALR